MIIPAPQFVSGGWDNRSMRIKLASAIVVIGLLGSSVTPANAVLGLSKCEKVKKQVLNYEKTEVSLNKAIKPFAGKSNMNFSITQNKSYYLMMKKFVAFEVTYLQYAYNNSECFTRSQNEFIDQAYKYAKQQQGNFDVNPYYINEFQNAGLLWSYPYNNNSVFSIYSR